MRNNNTSKCIVESYQNTKVSSVGWWCLLEPISIHTQKRTESVSHSWPALVHRCSLTPPLPTWQPWLEGQRDLQQPPCSQDAAARNRLFPAPAPAAIPHESHEAMSARAGVPTVPCPQIGIRLSTYELKRASCWKSVIAAWRQLPLEGRKV